MEVPLWKLASALCLCFTLHVFFFQTIHLKSRINISASLESEFYNSLFKTGKNNNAPLWAFPTSYYHSVAYLRKNTRKKKPERKSTNIMVSVSVFVIMWQIVTARKFKTFIDKE